jgi:hypothetical protein
MGDTLIDRVLFGLGLLIGPLIHRSRIVALEDGSWVGECSCGWASQALTRGLDAERAWDEHTATQRTGKTDAT